MKSMPDQFLAAKREENHSKLIAAYENYVRDPGRYENQFWHAILEFAKIKLHYLEIEFSSTGTSSTADDFAQDVAMGVWEGLRSFRGNKFNFYAWVHSICYKQAARFFNELKKHKYKKVGTSIVIEDENGFEEVVDNPEIYNSHNVLRDFFITIPDNIEGVNRDICLMILDGMSYKQVAEELGMSEMAVTLRIHRIREANKKGPPK